MKKFIAFSLVLITLTLMQIMCSAAPIEYYEISSCDDESDKQDMQSEYNKICVLYDAAVRCFNKAIEEHTLWRPKEPKSEKERQSYEIYYKRFCENIDKVVGPIKNAKQMIIDFLTKYNFAGVSEHMGACLTHALNTADEVLSDLRVDSSYDRFRAETGIFNLGDARNKLNQFYSAGLPIL